MKIARAGLLLGLVVCSAAVPVSARGAATPNVVLIISDDQAWTDYGFMGHKHIQAPNLDRLASSGVLFTRGYVPTALCRPSLASIITGLYPHQHKTVGNDPSPAPGGKEAADVLREKLIVHIDQCPTIPRLLRPRGYVSFQAGKWWEGSYRRGGFTEGMTRGFPEKGGRHGDDGLTIGRQGMKPVLDFIDQAATEKKPFFVWYAPMMPHTPHTPPERLLSKYRDKVESIHFARYYAMCEWFDETCGELIDHVDKKGLGRDTLFVYLADNGWIQRSDAARFADGSKQSPNEGGVRQPIILRWTGTIKPQKRDELVSSIDLAPTILSAAGVAIPRELPGMDLLPVIRDGKNLDRDAVFGEAYSHDLPEIDNPEASLLYRWVIEGRWKLILTYDGEAGRSANLHPLSDRRPRLYDLTADPHETKNLAAEHPELVKRLATRLDAWWPLMQRTTKDTH